MLFKNHLLRRSSAADLELIIPHLSSFALNRGQSLSSPGEAISHVVFVESGVLSVQAEESRNRIEVAMVGREGLSGFPLLLGCQEGALRVVVRQSGRGYRIAGGLFDAACERSPTLRRDLARYVYEFIRQMAETALGAAKCTVEQRVARWLLLAHDRTDGDHLPITHDALAGLLGVRRPGVTIATHVLEGTGAIRGNRGSIHIRDRSRLEVAALCGSADVAPPVPDLAALPV